MIISAGNNAFVLTDARTGTLWSVPHCTLISAWRRDDLSKCGIACCSRLVVEVSQGEKKKGQPLRSRHVVHDEQGLQEAVTMRNLCPSFEPIGLGAQ